MTTWTGQGTAPRFVIKVGSVRRLVITGVVDCCTCRHRKACWVVTSPGNWAFYVCDECKLEMFARSADV